MNVKRTFSQPLSTHSYNYVGTNNVRIGLDFIFIFFSWIINAKKTTPTQS